MSGKPLVISIPHSGERVPPETPWLLQLPESILMGDVDRYVDQLYAPILAELSISPIKTEWHRYACDLNRLPEDIDGDSVQGATHPSGKFSHGFHWSTGMRGEKLMPVPLTPHLHQTIVTRYFQPFHEELKKRMSAVRGKEQKEIFHLDLHSMPSVGTSEHRDPGEQRKDIVVSDCDGKSSKPEFKDLVIRSYEQAGFKVGYNWPYKGGRVTETYGQPAQGCHSIQVELNRKLYMDEVTKKLNLENLASIQSQLGKALRAVYASLPV